MTSLGASAVVAMDHHGDPVEKVVVKGLWQAASPIGIRTSSCCPSKDMIAV